MKWMLLLLLLLNQNSLWAATPDSQTQCASLKQQKEQIRKRLNAGYSFAEGEQLDKRDRELFQQIAAYCASPVADVRSSGESDDELDDKKQTAESSTTAPTIYADVSLQKMPAWSGNNAIFKGDKAAAWTEYYQVPARCRQKQLAEADFVACADHKALQRQQFEQRWQQLKFVPLTVGTTQAAIANPERQVERPTGLESIPAYAVDSTTSSLATSPESQPPTSRYVENIQQQFHWVGIAIIVLLAAGGWLIWR